MPRKNSSANKDEYREARETETEAAARKLEAEMKARLWEFMRDKVSSKTAAQFSFVRIYHLFGNAYRVNFWKKRVKDGLEGNYIAQSFFFRWTAEEGFFDFNPEFVL